MTRDEIKFHNFISRLNFKELIVKPIKLQMLIEFPELKDDEFYKWGRYYLLLIKYLKSGRK
jgi:hypothetical protein